MTSTALPAPPKFSLIEDDPADVLRTREASERITPDSTDAAEQPQRPANVIEQPPLRRPV